MKRWLFNIIWKTDCRTHQYDKRCYITQKSSEKIRKNPVDARHEETTALHTHNIANSKVNFLPSIF